MSKRDVRVQVFPKTEQETTVSFYRTDEKIEVYTSDSTMITKLLKVTSEEDREILTTDANDRITSMIVYLEPKQLSLRKKK